MYYSQLSLEERYQIKAYIETGKSLTKIAEKLGRHRATIFREISRNKGNRGYRPKQANSFAIEKRKNSFKYTKMTPNLISYIEEKINHDWSPEQVSGRLLKDKGKSISHERIYQHILKNKKEKGDLYTHLRCQKKRKKRYGSKINDRRGQIKNRISIDDRPLIVDQKKRIGDWEGDTIIGKNHKGAIVTLVERKTKKTLIKKVSKKEASVVSRAITELLKNEIVKTITFDNGKEFSCHKEVARTLKAKIYFAHPYSSWERGLNENTNGLIRQYLKKGTSFEQVSNVDIKKIQNHLNSRPRKTLDFCTPNEQYREKKSIKSVALIS